MSFIISRFFPVVMLVFSSTLAQTSNKPREDNPEYAKLDFWVGEWEVIAWSGVKAGENSIRKILDSEVDRDPTQWPWLHNRWHTAPDYDASKPHGLELFESLKKDESSDS